MRRRFYVGLISSVLWLTVPVATAYAATLHQLEIQQQQTEGQLSVAQVQSYQTENAVVQTLQQIQQTNTSLRQDRARVSAINGQIASTQQQLTQTELAIARIQAHLKYEAGLLKTQVRLMEERGPIGYLDVVLGAQSFSDFISRLYLLSRIASMAGGLVHQIRAEVTVEHRKKAQLVRQENALLTLRQQAQAAANQVQADLAHQQSLIARLRAQQISQQVLMQHLNTELASIAQQIQSLLTQYQGGHLDLHQLYNALYPLVQPIGRQFGLPPALIVAVITEESGGNAKAVSPTGAIGLMQVEPGTARVMGFPVSDLYNPQQNVLIGCTYLSEMLRLFGHTTSVSPVLASPPGNTASYLSDALAAYNAGPNAVQSYGLAGLFAKGWGVARYVSNIENLYLEYSAWGPP